MVLFSYGMGVYYCQGGGSSAQVREGVSNEEKTLCVQLISYARDKRLRRETSCAHVTARKGDERAGVVMRSCRGSTVDDDVWEREVSE